MLSIIMSRLLLIRHGQASFGAKNYDRLSMLGERQACITGHHLADVGQNFDVIVSGELSRQRRTAELAAAAWHDSSATIIDSAFNEYDPRALFKAYLPRVLDENPALAAKRDALFDDRCLFQRTFECLTRHWIAGTAHELASFETWADFTSRVGAGLARLHDNYGRNALMGLITSGGPIAVAVAASLGASAEHTLQLNWRIYNAAISELRSTRVGWRLMGFNNITHLRLTDDESLVTFR